MGEYLTHKQLRRFSECLGAIYDEPTGDNPVATITDALDRLVRIDSIAVVELRGDGRRIINHRHVATRRPELMDASQEIVMQVAHDHPLIQHTLRNGPSPCLKISDFVSGRQLRALSLYTLNNSKHKWRDQAAVLSVVGGGTMSFTLNRDRIFLSEEFRLLQVFQLQVQWMLARCAWFLRLPGREQLTGREREVLYWVTQGKRDEEVSVIIRCAERTVRQHMRAILRKLGVENRTSAIYAVLSGQAHEIGSRSGRALRQQVSAEIRSGR